MVFGDTPDRADAEVRRRDGLALLAKPPSTVHARAARLVELPVGATEDRLVGSLDLERALAQGVRAYQPGLLAEAHRGVLYVDEVNLLHDHLVDLLLDAAAMGRAHVERDGVSVSHAAPFLLVGTMNPEEGELRPQLLDRFGLTVEVRASRDVDTRVEVVRRRMAFESDPAGSPRRSPRPRRRRRAGSPTRGPGWPSVVLPDAELRRIAAVCASFDVDGMRADLVIARAATAHAAWRGADAVAKEDVRAAARLALPHRRRRDPFDEPGMDEQALDEALDGADPDGAGPRPGRPARSRRPGRRRAGARLRRRRTALPTERTRRRVQSDWPTPRSVGPRTTRGRPATGPRAPRPRRRRRSGPGGSRSRASARARPAAGRGPAPTAAGSSRPTHGTPRRAVELHLPATVAAAAPHQGIRGRPARGSSSSATDLRRAEREGREGNLVLFAVDASGSMAARRRMAAVSGRGAVAAARRLPAPRQGRAPDLPRHGRGGRAAADVQRPRRAGPARRAAHRAAAHRWPTGLLRARRLLAAERLRDPRRRALLVVLTDGRATVATRPGNDPVRDACRAAGLLAADGIATVVVDCEAGPVRLGLAARVAAAAGAPLVALADLSADRVAGVVHAARAA